MKLNLYSGRSVDLSLQIQPESRGNLCVVATKKKGETTLCSYLVVFRRDGTIHRNPVVGDWGFQLDENDAVIDV